MAEYSAISVPSGRVRRADGGQATVLVDLCAVADMTMRAREWLDEDRTVA